jgi:hypothetical protein
MTARSIQTPWALGTFGVSVSAVSGDDDAT